MIRTSLRFLPVNVLPLALLPLFVSGTTARAETIYSGNKAALKAGSTTANVARGGLATGTRVAEATPASDAATTNAATMAAASVADTAPVCLNGVVISIPGCAQARLSLGDRSCMRNGATIEYLVNGQPIATGRVISVGSGSSVATVIPESAACAVYINSEFRVITNPTAANAGPTDAQIAEREWNRFEREFAISAAVAAIAYYAFN